MPKLLVALLLAGAAWEDYRSHMISDWYMVGLTMIALLNSYPSAAQLSLAAICFLLSLFPRKRPCWGMGDGLLLGALSLSHSFFLCYGFSRYAPFFSCCMTSGYQVKLSH